MGLPLAASNFGYYHRRDLLASLRSIATIGYHLVEISAVPPHLYVPDFDNSARRQLKRYLNDLGLECTSVNTSELNLVSLNSELREVALRQSGQLLQLASDLGAPVFVLPAGRNHPLIPMPNALAVDMLVGAISQLLPIAESLGIVIALETSPFGILETGEEVADVVEGLNSPYLRVCYDCANAFRREDPVAGVHRVASLLAVAHLSDAWKSKWAHTSVGRGEIDFAAYALALSDAGFSGPTVYELMDGEDPEPRLRDDLIKLEGWGWQASPSSVDAA
jgi:sugar phosphate isomerase/epimerase